MIVHHGPPNTNELERKLENIQRSLENKNWWENTIVQLIMVIGAVAGIASLYAFFK